MISKKDFFKLISIAFFGKTIKNVRKQRDIMLITTEARRNYLVSKWNYDTTNFFTEASIANEKNERNVFINKPVYLGLAMLEISRIVMHEFWNNFIDN